MLDHCQLGPSEQLFGKYESKYIFAKKKMEMSSAKLQPFCLGLNVSNYNVGIENT